MSTWTHRLTNEEVEWAESMALQATLKHEEFLARKGGLRPDYNRETLLARQRLSWMGQIVASRVTGFKVITDYRDRLSGDLAGGIEVRTVDQPHFGIVIKDKDPFLRIFILVYLDGTLGLAKGWIKFTEEAKEKGRERVYEGRRGPEYTWTIREIHLNPMATLPGVAPYTEAALDVNQGP